MHVKADRVTTDNSPCKVILAKDFQRKAQKAVMTHRTVLFKVFQTGSKIIRCPGS